MPKSTAMRNYKRGYCALGDQGVTATVSLMKEGDEDATKAKKWLFSRLAGASTKSAGGVRMRVFKCFASLMTVCDVGPFLGLVLGSLHRAVSEAEATNNETEENVTFVKELIALLEDKVGTEMFMDAYAKVRGKAREKKEARKTEIAAEKVRDPAKAAQRKEAKKEKERERKKRRFEEKKSSGGFRAKQKRKY